MSTTLKVGTRGSALARAQTAWVIKQLIERLPSVTCQSVSIATRGDEITTTHELGTGVFVKEVQQALLDGRIDLAVHSLKDLPTDPAAGLSVAAVPVRADAREALVGATLAGLPQGARVGTGSPRRMAQLRRARPDLDVVAIRGNVPTRVAKARSGEVAAVMLAAAGLARLELDADDLLDVETFLPAPGQGALAIEVREGDEATRVLVATLEDFATRSAVTAERAVLRELGGGCMLPVAALGHVVAGMLVLHASVTSPDGSRQVAARDQGRVDAAEEVGASVAAQLRKQGAMEVLGAGNA